MPVFLVSLHHFFHFITGGLDCVIILVLLFPYFAYRIWIKKDFNLKKFIKHDTDECGCNKKHKK